MKQPQGFEGLIVVVVLKLTVSNPLIARNIRAILTKFPVDAFKWWSIDGLFVCVAKIIAFAVGYLQ